MDDRFLRDHAREARPEFERELRERLHRQEARVGGGRQRLPIRAALATAAAVLLVGSLFAFPAARDTAQAFLDQFRVRNFAAVSIDMDRVRQLEDGKLDLKALLSDRVETLQKPGEPKLYASAQAAGAAAGIMAGVPSMLPRGLTADTVLVRGEGAARVTVDVPRLQQVLDALELTDVHIPANLNGAQVTVRMPSAVLQHFANGKLEAELMQSRSPEVSLPPGADLAQLGEIGLRILGLDATEAHRFASTIDWHSTFLVPVPAKEAEFRQVEVNGHHALLVTAREGAQAVPRKPGVEREGGRHDGRARNVLLWSDGDMVYALCGNLSNVDLMQMAVSIR
jgi:hypothetical protein